MEGIEIITHDEALRRVQADPKDYRAWIAIATLQAQTIAELREQIATLNPRVRRRRRCVDDHG